MNPKTRLGAQVRESQLQAILGYVEKGKAEGATLVAGGQRAAVDGKGAFMQATVFSRRAPTR